MVSGGRLEWKMNVSNGTTKVLEPERGIAARILQKLHSMIVMKTWKFLVNSWNIGVTDPKKFVHCLKVGLALSVVSLLYYMRPLYDGVGKNAMWAIMTVVVVCEYTVGSTIYKSVNRTVATVVAGSLGVGIHWIANQCDKQYQPIFLGASVFIFASTATFTRFIPTVKARFDYGAMIFILTFSLVSISGYRVEDLIMMAHQRVSTIAIGVSLCILISMLLWPVWAGDQLHNQTISNLEKLANSLEGYIAEYFSNNEETAKIPKDDETKKLQGYKCVLNSKASEDSMVNFAIWEPAHGRFYFGYPWKQYQKIGAAARSCAYCIDNLNSCIDSEMQAPELLKQYITERCTKLSLFCSEVLKDLATTIKTRKRSSSIDFLVDRMIFGVEEFQNDLKSLPCDVLSLTTAENSTDNNGEKLETPNQATMLEVLPLGMLVTLLIEIVARIEEVVKEVDNLANMAEFKIQKEKKLQEIPNQNKQTNTQGQEIMKAIEEV
ncbi:aluminum-activated malate transporter 10-like [Chenopodium quinoa]|uniref:Uncharacterized protein n=1 Tax=Chenopodium quinoa TaxID=63459 RepID=A0A803KZR2_CHEQI|nr:aluminum-activated malate transporter 10-like [Chenopodium quinoa]